MRIALSDDPWDRAVPTSAARIRLDNETGDPCGAPSCAPADEQPAGPASPGWKLTVRQRGPRGRDADGTQLYGWSTVWTGTALATSSGVPGVSRGRTETSDATGQAFVTASVILVAALNLDVNETAVAWDDDGNRWEITAANAVAEGTRLELERVADDG